MRIDVWVKTRSKREGVTRRDDGSYEVSVNAVAEKGRANRAVLVLLAEYLGVPVSQLSIVLGHSARRKVVEVP